MRDGPCTPRLRSVSSYGNIRAVTAARSLNKSLQNLSLTEEGRRWCWRWRAVQGRGVLSGAFQQAPPSFATACALQGWRLSRAPPVTVVPRAGASLAGQVPRPQGVRAQLQGRSGRGVNPRFHSRAADCETGRGIQPPR